MLLALMFSTEVLSAQDKKHYVTALSGLRMRDSPSLNATKLVTIPFGAVVFVTGKGEGEHLEIEHIYGMMSPVRYSKDGKTYKGYVFDGFLADEDPSNYQVMDKEMLLIRQRTEAEWEAIRQEVSDQDMAEIGSDAAFYASEGSHVLNQHEELKIVDSEARFFLFKQSNGKKYFYDATKYGPELIVMFQPNKAPKVTSFLSIAGNEKLLDYFK